MFKGVEAMRKVKQDVFESIQEFTLLDDAFMTKVFEDDLERTQFLLRIILNDDKITVKFRMQHP